MGGMNTPLGGNDPRYGNDRSHGRCDFTWEVWLGFFLWHLLKLHLHLLFMSHGRCDFTWEVWLGFFLLHLLNLHLHPIFMSHGRCDLSLYICTSYIYIYTFLLCSTPNTKKKLQIEPFNDAHLVKPWPCSSWFGLGFLGLGLLGLRLIGLGPHLLKRLIRRTLDVLVLVHSSY